MTLELKHVIYRGQPNITKLCYISVLKQLYISNKKEHFSYKDGCGVHVSKCLKEEVDGAIDKLY